MKTKIFDYPYINKDMIKYCVKELYNGNIGIFPTDTVYGIGCDALNIEAIKKLYDIKKRDYNKPINILISKKSMMKKLTKKINPIEKKLIKFFWPGDLTIIFDKSSTVPDILTSGLSTVGIRMPKSDICLDLINKYGSPIAASSANISNKSPALKIEDCFLDFKDNVSFMINNSDIEFSVGIPSTIVRVNEDSSITVIREGNISVEDIKKCFGGKIHVK